MLLKMVTKSKINSFPTDPTDPTFQLTQTSANLRFCFIKKSPSQDFIIGTLVFALLLL